MSNTETYGLIFTLPGAPNEPHFVGEPITVREKKDAKGRTAPVISYASIPGYFRPDVPTPVGIPGGVTLEQAKALDANPVVPLKLVPIESEDVEDLTKKSEDTKKEAATAARNQKRTAKTENEVARVAAAAAATQEVATNG